MDEQNHTYFNLKDKTCGFLESGDGFLHLNTFPQYGINMNLL